MGTAFPAPPPGFRYGETIVLVPICVKTWLGFIGGPSGYWRTTLDEPPDGPIVVEAKPNQ